MIFDFLRRVGNDRLESIEAKLQAMLRLDRQEFDLAMSALLGDVGAEDVRGEVREADQQVNRLEREIRREIVVHLTVVGHLDTPAVLMYMSIVKDVERVGDYAKNLLDLARDGANFSALGDTMAWRALAAELGRLITDAAAAFQHEDIERSRDLHRTGDALLGRFDDAVSALVHADDQDPQAVPRALAYRYLKRIVAHLMNLLSAVTMPLDQLDYFDEDPEDRTGG